MTHVSLFSGIGGIDLAAEWAGFRTIAQVERDPYCLKVLAKHWPGVHRCAEIRDFPDQEYGTVTLVSGGFPCQPFSSAGKRRGTADDRHLWPEMYRVLRTLVPRWVLAENVPGIRAIERGMVFESVLADLEAEGYEIWAGLIPAAGVGAPHLRYRVFVVGHANSTGRQQESRSSYEDESQNERRAEIQTYKFAGSGKDVAHSDRERFKEQRLGISAGNKKENIEVGGSRSDVAYRSQSERGWSTRIGWREERGTVAQYDWWSVEPDVGRVAHGVPYRVDRLRALGNAVMPQQVYPILKAIADVENESI